MENFLNKVFITTYLWGGLKFVGLVATLVLLVIGALKLSYLRPLWDRLGNLKSLVAPLLSLILGLTSLLISDEPITLHGLFTYLLAGSGSIILHDLFDAVKSLPFISPAYQKVVQNLQDLLRQHKTKATHDAPRDPNNTISRR